MKYKCPSCGFPILSRRVNKCESCGATVPPELLYSEQQIAAIDAEFDVNKRKVAKLRSNLGLNGGGGGCGGDGWVGGDGGCDGGGDCG